MIYREHFSLSLFILSFFFTSARYQAAARATRFNYSLRGATGVEKVFKASRSGAVGIAHARAIKVRAGGTERRAKDLRTVAESLRSFLPASRLIFIECARSTRSRRYS